MKKTPEDQDSDSDASDEASDYEENNGADILPTTAMDIPRVDDIPIVSQLAKKSQKELLAEMDAVEQKQHKI